MNLKQLSKLYCTLKFLKLTQAYHQIKYRLVKPKRVATPFEGDFSEVDLVVFPEKQKSLLISKESLSFSFLNLSQSFVQDSIHWSFGDYGMLWTYNLNYFDWLHQPGMSKEQGLEILSEYYATPIEKNPIILHPYPTSLRIINVAKFISKWKIKEDWLYYELVADLKFVSGRLEFHLLANHLLENAFALYIGGLMTNQNEFTRKGKKLLVRELKKQVLNDGMHYERSPMYHLIILERLLDALNFAKAGGDDLVSTLKSYSVRMTGLAMNWKDLNRIPMMQDSAYGIALSVTAILEYSQRLLGEDYPTKSNKLMDSGYRSLNSGNLSLFANVGSIGPSYQPGHAHADELNFEIFYKGAPIIVDSGISTYEKNARRQEERSTKSHNCVTFNSTNSSDVWSGFRVGRRAQVELLNDDVFIKAKHSGYKNCVISRIWYSGNGDLVIVDEVETSIREKKSLSKGRLHFHPDLTLKLDNNGTLRVGNELVIEFSSPLREDLEIRLEEYNYAQGYNHLRKARVVIYACYDQMKITIREAS